MIRAIVRSPGIVTEQRIRRRRRGRRHLEQYAIAGAALTQPICRVVEPTIAACIGHRRLFIEHDTTALHRGGSAVDKLEYVVDREAVEPSNEINVARKSR